MKFLAVTLACSSIAPLMAETSHTYGAKHFFRAHREENYNFDLNGIGFHYHLKRDQGMNFKFSLLSSLGKKEFIETESSLIFSHPFGEGHAIQPVISMRNSSHLVAKLVDGNIFIHKGTAFIGLGWLLEINDNVKFSPEMCLFQDILNSQSLVNGSDYIGSRFSNPAGGKIKLGLQINKDEKRFVRLDVFAAKTFKNCYKQIGSELALNWGF